MIIAQDAALRWITTAPGHPYFLTEDGHSWTPIGQNDAVDWPDLAGLFRRRDMARVEGHLRWLKAHGVTCLRVMLEYCHREHRYLEKPVGVFQPGMVQLWDDLFGLLERIGLHVLLTPYDTFFTWIRWGKHPLNRRNGGPCASRRDLLICPHTREAIKARLAFASDRWGGSPALFAWDIWNEMHPAQSRDDAAHFEPFITDIATWLRAYETERHGRAHVQTASIFGPELLRHPLAVEPIFRHPALDCASPHLYESGTIDDPRDTIAPALAVGRLIRLAIQDAHDGRPVFDSEHGPIHRFKDHRKTLPEAFDDEYFRHMQWAHLASGGAGGGMRWPNRHPHVLTHGMRAAQRGLHAFLGLIDWTRLIRRNLNEEVTLTTPGIARFACGDAEQAIVWLLRTDSLNRDGTIAPDTPPLQVTLTIPGLAAGPRTVCAFDTQTGRIVAQWTVTASDGGLTITTPEMTGDLALAVRS